MFNVDLEQTWAHSHPLSHLMKIVRLALCFIALIALGVLALVIANPYLLKMSVRSQAEYDYNRLVSEAKTEIYVGSPELIERIAMDKRFAETIT